MGRRDIKHIPQMETPGLENLLSKIGKDPLEIIKDDQSLSDFIKETIPSHDTKMYWLGVYYGITQSATKTSEDGKPLAMVNGHYKECWEAVKNLMRQDTKHLFNN